MRKVFVSLVAALSVLCLSSFGQTAGEGNAMNPVGAWDVTVTPEGPAPPFQGLHVYNFGGTATNTATACNSISSTPTGGQCSDSYGVWERISGNRFVHTWYEQYYVHGEHVGFIKVRGVFTMESKDRLSGHNQVFILLGTDLAEPDQVILLHSETFEGRRIHAELPSQ